MKIIQHFADHLWPYIEAKIKPDCIENALCEFFPEDVVTFCIMPYMGHFKYNCRDCKIEFLNPWELRWYHAHCKKCGQKIGLYQNGGPVIFEIRKDSKILQQNYGNWQEVSGRLVDSRATIVRLPRN